MTDLSVSVAGLNFTNPLLPGSGPPGDNLHKLQKLAEAGIGGLVTKTISVNVPSVPRPCMAFDGDLFFNVEKWSEKPVEEWTTAILPKLQNRSLPLIVSLGYTRDDLSTLVPIFNEWADGFEISTHYVSSSPADLESATRLIKSLTRKPVFMKLSAHATDIVANAKACEQGGADGITAINSVGPVLSIDIEKRSSRLGEDIPYAWLSGPAIKPTAVRAVYDISRAVKIPVIGCGGVSSGRDLIEFLMAGASAVECCTALTRKGADLVPELLKDVREWCESHQVKAIRDLTGTVVPHYQPVKDIR
jgi:dihydroorotate dehydrogenase (NAD+) catalytic subunit